MPKKIGFDDQIEIVTEDGTAMVTSRAQALRHLLSNGVSLEEIASQWDVSERTVRRMAQATAKEQLSRATRRTPVDLDALTDEFITSVYHLHKNGRTQRSICVELNASKRAVRRAIADAQRKHGVPDVRTSRVRHSS
jgi:DNA-binding NarL/FixJ family response regulator